MKFKHLIIVGMILAILTVGAVSASQDIEGNDTIAQPADDELVIEQSSDDDSQDLAYDEEDLIGASDDSEDIIGDYESGSVTIKVNKNVDIGEDKLGLVRDDKGLKGTITVTIDGKKVFTKKFTDGKTKIYRIGNKDIDLSEYCGVHTVKITYDNGKKRSDSAEVNIFEYPEIRWNSPMSVGEKNGVIITAKSGLDGTATLYFRKALHDADNNTMYQRGDAFKTVKITDGYAFIPLDSLANGTYSFELVYEYGTIDSTRLLEIIVQNNSPGFASSVSPLTIMEGQSVKVKLTGPKAEGYATIDVDNMQVKEVRFNFGSIEEVVSGLAPGSHLITVRYYEYGSSLFYSETYNVFVKEHVISLKLKKVKVKRSAKKLVIKATLKIDGKAAKNKKLTFKFNKIKYTAKTNKKGVAKVTVKKNILKKLKKGKKVKYQVTYGKTTVKQSVKVKK